MARRERPMATPEVPGSAVVHWGITGGREGWLVTFPDGSLGAVLGPSICRSSGGGPREALAAALRWYPELAEIRLEVREPARHSYWPTRAICQYCRDEAAEVTEEQRRTLP